MLAVKKFDNLVIINLDVKQLSKNPTVLYKYASLESRISLSYRPESFHKIHIWMGIAKIKNEKLKQLTLCLMFSILMEF